jgi:aspartyl-tRNA(Asn)/glutamyl-tRNA(Gln) amidotransferase subunit A
MSHIAHPSLRQLVGDIRARKTTPTEIMHVCLDTIERRNPAINAFVHVEQKERLLELAANADISSPLAGLPVAIKDNLCSAGMRTTAASRTLSSYFPTYDAEVVSRIKAAGGIVVGKTNMDEFGMGSSTENSAFGVTKNPLDEARVAGGSSGGSAAAVASGMVGFALGSDTGGSVRQPASFCGVTGLKPTYGRISRHGLISYGSSLDCVGLFAPSCDDLRFILSEVELFGDKNGRDMTVGQGDGSTNDTRGDLELETVKVGVISDFKDHPVTLKAIEELKKHNVRAEVVTLDTYSHGLPAYYILALSEASSNLSRYDGIRYGKNRDLLSTEVKRRILMGTYALSAGYYDAYYKKAQQVRTLVTEEMEACLQEYDFLISPVAPTSAYTLGEKTKDPLEMYKGDLMTVNVNLSGLPAVSVPLRQDTNTSTREGTVDGTVDGTVEGREGGRAALMPENIQIIGRRYDELRLLEFGSLFC